MLWWIVELGRVDILVPVAMLSRYLTPPRRGHLDQVFHVFAYLKRYNKSALVFDNTVPIFEPSRFTKADWEQFYPDATKAVLPKRTRIAG